MSYSSIHYVNMFFRDFLFLGGILGIFLRMLFSTLLSSYFEPLLSTDTKENGMK